MMRGGEEENGAGTAGELSEVSCEDTCGEPIEGVEEIVAEDVWRSMRKSKCKTEAEELTVGELVRSEQKEWCVGKTS